MAESRVVLEALSSGRLSLDEAVVELLHERDAGGLGTVEDQASLIDRYAADGRLEPQHASQLRAALSDATRVPDTTRVRSAPLDETLVGHVDSPEQEHVAADPTRLRPSLVRDETEVRADPALSPPQADTLLQVDRFDDHATMWRSSPGPPDDIAVEATIQRHTFGPRAETPLASPSHLEPGSVVHEWYRLEKPLGAGAMGQVWMATDLQRLRAGDPQPRVALKLVGADFARNELAMVAMQREASKAQQLAHPNIATVFVFAEDPKTGQCYLAMELLEGQPLDRLLREQTRGLAHEEGMAIIRGLASGLAYAHLKGVVHCDFKPGNAFVTDAGVAKVLDFGIARLAKQVARSGDSFDAGVLGALTPAYASLEMLRGDDPHPADDVYALGLVAYEVLSGRHPFGRASADDARARGLRPTPLKGVRRREWKAIERSLRFERSERWPDAQAFLKALEGISPWVPALGGLAAILALVAGYVAYQNHLDTLPKIPFDQLPAEVQSDFRSAMKAGDYSYRFGTGDARGAEAVQAIYRDALSAYAAAYALHPRNPDADAALRRSLEFLEDHLRDQDPAVRAEARNVLQGYRDQYQALAKYGPLEDLINRLSD